MAGARRRRRLVGEVVPLSPGSIPTRLGPRLTGMLRRGVAWLVVGRMEAGVGLVVGGLVVGDRWAVGVGVNRFLSCVEDVCALLRQESGSVQSIEGADMC